MAKHRIQGELTRIITSKFNEVIGFEILDEDRITLLDGRSWNPTHTVWGSGNLPPVGSIITVTGTDWYQSISDYVTEAGEAKTSKRWNLKTITNLEVLAQPKPATVEATAAAIQDIAATTGKELPF